MFLGFLVPYVLCIFGFQRFIKTPPLQNSACFEHARRSQLFRAQEIISFCWYPSGFRKYWSRNYWSSEIPKRHVMFCSRYWYRISKLHSCFLIDIGLVSKFFMISLNGSSSFSVPVFSINSKVLEVQNFLICKSNMFLNWFWICLVFVKVFWW